MNRTTHPTTPPAELSDAALAAFTDYFVRNYPGTVTISYPEWHAPRIFRAAKHAIEAARELPAASLGEDVWGRFASWLLDKCEGMTVSEEMLQQQVAAMLAANYGAPTPSAAGSGDRIPHGMEEMAREGYPVREGIDQVDASKFPTQPAKPEAGEVVTVPRAMLKKWRRAINEEQAAYFPDTIHHLEETDRELESALTAKAEGDGGDQFGGVNDMVLCRCVEGSRDAELCMDKHECRSVTATTKAHP